MLDKGRHPTNARGEQWPPEIFNIILKSVQKKEGRKEKRREGEEKENPEDTSGTLALSFKQGVTTYLPTE